MHININANRLLYRTPVTIYLNCYSVLGHLGHYRVEPLTSMSTVSDLPTEPRLLPYQTLHATLTVL